MLQPLLTRRRVMPWVLATFAWVLSPLMTQEISAQAMPDHEVAVRPLTVAVIPVIVFSGRVIDQRGCPIPAARIGILSAVDWGDRRERFNTTDQDGFFEYRLRATNNGLQADIEIRRSGYAPSRRTVTISHRTDLEFSIEPLGQPSYQYRVIAGDVNTETFVIAVPQGIEESQRLELVGDLALRPGGNAARVRLAPARTLAITHFTEGSGRSSIDVTADDGPRYHTVYRPVRSVTNLDNFLNDMRAFNSDCSRF